MAFTVEDVQDLIRLLAQHPEWRAELRPLILGDEILGLPAALRELAVAQSRTEAAVARLSDRVEELAAAQTRTEAAVARLSDRVVELAAAQARTEARLEELVAAQARTETKLEELITDHKRVVERLGRVDGRTLEQQFRSRAHAYFSRHLLKAKVVDLAEIGADDALQEGRLDDGEHDELSRLDLIVRGLARHDSGRELLLGVEISTQIRESDVIRARHRAQILERLGYQALAVVGGERIGPAARKAAETAGVIVRLVDAD